MPRTLVWRSTEYTISQVIQEHGRVAVYRGERVRDRRRVIIKVLSTKHRRPRDVDRFKNAYEIENRLNINSVVKPLELVARHGTLALIVEDYGGESLGRQLGPRMELKQFLRLAVKLAQALAELHEQGVVHKDIKPQNILIHPETGEVRLTDLEIASLIPSERMAALSPQLIEGSLPYMSPEQTGRTNQAVDVRSDLYSLGITLFELRSGKLPFQATDPLGWIHNQLARTPPLLSAAAPGTPAVVSDVVTKLMAKAPEDRYQSALGLKYDLERCIAGLTSDSDIEPFPLGERDISERFQIPQKLYGRGRQVAELLAEFEGVVATGNPKLLLVSGYSGIGKSSLVRELYLPIVRERGFFITGKFDQVKRGIPFTTLAQAFQSLIQGLLTEGKERIAPWRERLQEALGGNAQIMIDLIPEVELLIGKQPPVPALPLDQAESRFQLVFQKFLSVFARKEHPLVLFLDDLQWADSASLKLIESIFFQSESKYLCLIGGYRDNEVTASHPLAMSLSEIRKAGVSMHELVLFPLSRADIVQLVSDTVHRPAREVEALAALVDEMSGGNPFFAIQFLTELHEERLIQFNPIRLEWRWDLSRIRAKKYSDNVIDLLVRRIDKLPEKTGEALKIAACIGNVFDVGILALLEDRSESQMHQQLWDALRTGLLSRTERKYRFLHDRIQQASYSLIPENRRAEEHLRIGRLLLAHVAPQKLRSRVFDIVNQLNLGAPLIESREERGHLAELNLMAGLKAKSDSAYSAASEYLAAGIALLARDAWQSCYSLAYPLYLARAQCEFLNKKFESTESLLQQLLENVQDRLDLADVYSLEIQLQTNKPDPAKSLKLALDYLRQFNINLPLRPSREQVVEEGRRVMAALGDDRSKL